MEWKNLLEPRTAEGRATIGRTDFERDQDRVIFSSPFRRLDDKTQVLPIPERYFVHNRMTHSIETACVGRSLGSIVGARVLAAADPDWSDATTHELGDLVQAACLAHDIGNPPFGHSGEDAISAFFEGRPDLLEGLSEAERRDFTRFEGNAQGFRLISGAAQGLRLTKNTAAAFAKYPRESLVSRYLDPRDSGRRDQKKYGAFQGERACLEDCLSAFGARRLSAEGLAFARYPFAHLVEAADDICYLVIDLEDAVRLGIIRLAEVEAELEAVVRDDPESGGVHSPAPGPRSGEAERVSYFRARAINSLIFQCAAVFAGRKAEILDGRYATSLTAEIPSAGALEAIGRITREKLYRYRPVLEIEAAGFEIMGGLLELLTGAAFGLSGPRGRMIRELFPEIGLSEASPRYDRLRSVTDYVSGMTDSFAISEYRRLRGYELPRMY